MSEAHSRSSSPELTGHPSEESPLYETLALIGISESRYDRVKYNILNQ